MQDTPDEPFDPSGFARSWWEQNRRLSNFEDHILFLGDDGFDFNGTGTDSYDASVEVYGVTPLDYLLNEHQQRLIFESGFLACFVNYDSGPGRHYRWERPEFRTIDVPGRCSSRPSAHKVG